MPYLWSQFPSTAASSRRRSRLLIHHVSTLPSLRVTLLVTSRGASIGAIHCTILPKRIIKQITPRQSCLAAYQQGNRNQDSHKIYAIRWNSFPKEFILNAMGEFAIAICTQRATLINNPSDIFSTRRHHHESTAQDCLHRDTRPCDVDHMHLCVFQVRDRMRTPRALAFAFRTFQNQRSDPAVSLWCAVSLCNSRRHISRATKTENIQWKVYPRLFTARVRWFLFLWRTPLHSSWVFSLVGSFRGAKWTAI